MTIRVRWIGVPPRWAPGPAPPLVSRGILSAPTDGKALVILLSQLRIAERIGGVSNEVGLSSKVGGVVQPAPLDRFVGEVGALLPNGFLLPVCAEQWIDVREELLRARLRNVPRRIAEYRMKARARRSEHVGEFELPMEEPLATRHSRCHPARFTRRGREVGRKRCNRQLVGRPEPARAPQVH